MRSTVLSLLFASTLLAPGLSAQGRPDPAAQKSAMQKLKYLAGTWTGQGTVTPAQGEPIQLQQTEEVQYKLDGLLLVIEGTGRDASGKVLFNAFAVISYDTNTSTYRFRAWNSGNVLETELKLTEKGFDWNYQQGPLTMTNQMILDEQGRWSENSEASLAGRGRLHGVRLLLTKKP